MKNKKILFLIVFLLPFSIFFNKSFAKDNSSVTDRELLILSQVSYFNNLEKSIPKMLDPKNNFVPIISQKINPAEMNGWELVDYDINIDNKSKSGFSAMVCKKNDNIVIAFRGSDGGVFSENWKYFVPFNAHPQNVYVKNFMKKISSSEYFNDSSRIYTTGHSLGGYLSLYGAGTILSMEKLNPHFEKVVSFGAFGLGRITDRNEIKALKSADKKRIVNYRIEGDVTQCIGVFVVSPITLKRVEIPEINGSPKWLYNCVASKAHCLVQFFYQNRFDTQAA